MLSFLNRFFQLFVFSFALTLCGTLTLAAQPEGYIIEEESFGLDNNEFRVVSSIIDDHVYILQSDLRKFWVYNTQDNTMTNLLSSDTTLYATGFEKFKDHTFFYLSCPSGLSVYKTKNTWSSTQKIFQVNDYQSDGFQSSIFVHNDRLYIAQDRTHMIYRLDDPNGEVELFLDMSDQNEPEFPWYFGRRFFTVDSLLFFNGKEGEDEILWKVDDDPSSLAKVTLETGQPLMNLDERLFYKNSIYFSLDDDIKQTWYYDLSAKEIKLFGDFEFSSAWGRSSEYANGSIIQIFHPQYKNEPWFFDGTIDGSYLLKDISENGNSNPSRFTEFGGKIGFKANFDERWETDGTPEGTIQVGTVVPNFQIDILFDRQFELRSKDDDYIILSEYLGDGVSIDIAELEGKMPSSGGESNLGSSAFTKIFDDFFFVQAQDFENDTYNNYWSDGTSENTHKLDNIYNFGYIDEKFELEDRVIIFIRDIGRNFYYNVRKVETEIIEPTMIDSSSVQITDSCEEIVSGIEILSGNGEVLVIPNPASDQITVRAISGKRIKLKVIDTQGKVIRVLSSLKEEHIVSLRGEIPGMYYLHIIEENSEVPIVSRFVKQ